MCKNLPFIGSERGHDAIDKIKALNGNGSNKETIAWLYGALNILDAKANSLLRVNSMFITVLSIFWAAARTTGNPLKMTHEQTVAIVLAWLIVMSSTVFCFLIVRVNWKFLGSVKKDNEVYDFEREAKHLANIVDNRTHYYWLGWLLTFVVIWLPLLLWLQLIPSHLLLFLETYIPAPEYIPAPV